MNKLLSISCSSRRAAYTRTIPANYNNKMAGFNLVELLIVVAIIGLLASAALPSFTSYSIKERRSDAHHLMQINANRLARCLTFSGTYDHADCKLLTISEEGYYEGSVHIDKSDNTWEMIVTAVPDGPQANDDECLNFSLNSLGEKSSGGMNGTTYTSENHCW